MEVIVNIKSFLIIFSFTFSTFSLFSVEQEGQKYQLNELVTYKKKQWQVVTIAKPEKKTFKNVNSSSVEKTTYTFERSVIPYLLKSQLTCTDRISQKRNNVSYSKESFKPTGFGYATILGVLFAGSFGLYKLFN